MDQRARSEPGAAEPCRQQVSAAPSAAGCRGPGRPALPPGVGNRALARLAQEPATTPDANVLARSGLLAPAPRAATRTPQAKREVSSPQDPLELEADAVAARVVPGGVSRRPAPPAGAEDASVAARRTGPARDGSATPEVSSRVESLIGAPGAGSPLPAGVRARIEPELASDLSAVRVHTGPEAQAAASSLEARAFTTGRDVFLGAGESPDDVGLMAHEATHVVQQGGGVQRLTAPLQREAEDEEDGLLDVDVTGWIEENVAEAAAVLPGYTMLGQVLGHDPITGQPVDAPQQEWLESLLTWGEAAFGPAVGPVLAAAEVLGDVIALVREELAARDLTFARLERDLAGAWEEFAVYKGVSGNLEILDRYLNALLADVGAFVAAIADRVIAAVREVVAELVAPLLESEAVRPVWSLATKVFHYDPLRGTEVTAPTVEILAEFLALIGQDEALAQLQDNGALARAAEWLDTQWTAFTSILDETGRLFTDAWDAISPQNLPELLATLPGLVDRGIGLVGQVLDFGGTLLGKALELVKEALLGALSAHAHELPGFHLLTVILEQNPFTGQAVARTAENLIRGFLTLVEGGEQTYQQLAESGVIADAAARITGEMGRLGISVGMITETFLGVWDTLSLEDLLSPVEAFERVLERFGEPLSRLVEFVGVVVEVLITLVLQIMNFPSDLLASILDKISQSVDHILADPVGFLVNMVEALKTGFSGFLDNVVTYLVQGLGDWLLRGLGQLGISLPADLSPASILDVVLQVLGVGVETLWRKLGEHIGEDQVDKIRNGLDALGGAWDFLKDVQERGLAAIWDYVSGQLSGLWDSLLDMAKDWIVTEIVQAAAARLLQMLDPTGIMAIVNSIRAFVAAVQSVIEYVRDILEIVDRYVSTFAAVAAGDIAPGAAMLEQGLAAAIPVALGFLANQAGVGNIPEKIVELIQGLRELIDQALDWLFEQAMRLGGAALGALGVGGEESSEWQADDAETPASAAVKEEARSAVAEGIGPEDSRETIEALLAEVLGRLRPEGLVGLRLGEAAEDGSMTVLAAASPETDLLTLIPRVSEGSRAAVRTLVRLTLSEGPNVHELTTETVPAEPTSETIREHIVAEYGAQALRRGQGIETSELWMTVKRNLTTTYQVQVPARLGVDAAAPVRRTRMRTLERSGESVEIQGRTYHLVRRVEPAASSVEHSGAVFTGADNEVHAEFWSTGGGEPENSSSHAETQFTRWYEGLDQDVRSRVESIELQNDPWCPCWSCCGRLVAFLMRVARGAQASIRWDEAYERNEAGGTRGGGWATPSALDDLGAVWSTRGPYPVDVVGYEKRGVGR